MGDLQGHDFMAFKAISSMVIDVASQFGKGQRSLALYARLLEKTMVAHEDAIKKHISAFRAFSSANRDAIKSKDATKLLSPTVAYSTNVFINFSNLFSKCAQDPDSTGAIWGHLQTISAIVDPEGGAREVLKQAQKQEGGGESNFLTDIIQTIESNIDPDARNPSEAISSMLASGALNNIMTDMTTQMESGNLDLGNMLGAVQGMMSKTGASGGIPPEMIQMTEQLGKMLSASRVPPVQASEEPEEIGAKVTVTEDA